MALERIIANHQQMRHYSMCACAQIFITRRDIVERIRKIKTQPITIIFLIATFLIVLGKSLLHEQFCFRISLNLFIIISSPTCLFYFDSNLTLSLNALALAVLITVIMCHEIRKRRCRCCVNAMGVFKMVIIAALIFVDLCK